MPRSSMSSGLLEASRAGSSDSSGFLSVSIEVPANHRLLVLKKELPWPELEQLLAAQWRAAGKNVDGGRGRPFDLPFYTRVIVLMLLLRLQPRQLERELKENAPARLFVEVAKPTESLVRDHANLDRTMRALGARGIEELGALLLRKAQELSFLDADVLSADTTAQELPIGYPNEPGILRQVAQRFERLIVRLRGAGLRLGKDLLEPGRKVLRLVKEHRLFAKTPEHKRQMLRCILMQSQHLFAVAEQVQQRLAARSGSFFTKASDKLAGLTDFLRRLTPQIQHWMATGRVAKDKLLHPGLQQARAIVREKLGKKCEFGFSWLICRLGGGYAFGKMLLQGVAESGMPLLAVELYQRIFGATRLPRLEIYDRGGWAKKTVQTLRDLGIEKIGIVPRGRADWLVEEADRDTVKTHRAQTEAVIGTLKSEFYGFNNPKQRSTQTVQLAGQASVVSFNLNLDFRRSGVGG